MALWVRFHMSGDIDEWARRSVRQGVSWYTGRRHAFDGQSKPFARFSFAWLNEREPRRRCEANGCGAALAQIRQACNGSDRRGDGG
jgi:DNA-binding transcriptional MocR family regulator